MARTEEAMQGADGWRTRRLAAEEVVLVWPIVCLHEPDASFACWHAHWSRWLAEGATTRRAIGLSLQHGALLAAWLAELVGAAGTRSYTVVRLWLVEPATPGRVLAACLGALRRCAFDEGCASVGVPMSALHPGLDREILARCAAAAGFVVAGDAWRACPAMPG